MKDFRVELLQHGYVRFIEAWGHGIEGRDSDEADYPHDLEVGIIEAARMSTGRGFNGWEKDEKLLTYLYEHKHMTPFEMAGMTIEIQAPIFVFREWHRHRTQSYNEMSARYIPLPDVNYVPHVFRVVEGAAKAGANKQAQSVTQLALDQNGVRQDLELLEAVYTHAQETYQLLLDHGWPKELARLCVPVGRFSRMRASANLRNWLAFLTLRMHPDAQQEIRMYANIVGEIVSKVFPRTWKLFDDERTSPF